MLSFGMPTLIELNSPEEHAALCRELGLDFVEFNMSFPQYQPESFELARYQRIKKEYGIGYTVHLDESFDVCSVNRRIGEVYLGTFLEAAELAKKLEIPSLNMHLLRGIYVTLPERRTYVYAENEELYLEKLRIFRDKADDVLRGSGIRVNVENTDGYNLPFLLHGLDTLLESPVFGLTYDIGHDNAIGGADRSVIEARGDRLHHMHMHDGKGKSVHLALGDGDMDIGAYRRLAEAHNCRVVLETKTVAALKKSVEYLKK